MLELTAVTKIYDKNKDDPMTALHQITLSVAAGTHLLITGESGAGKTTLLKILGLIDRDFAGTYRVNHQDVKQLKDRDLAGFRNAVFGMVFQNYVLIENDTVYENIEVPLLYSRKFAKQQFQNQIEAMADAVELGSYLHKKVRHLSGGERQRVAIARALVHRPEVLLMDEALAALNRELDQRIDQRIRAICPTIIEISHHEGTIRNHPGRIINLSHGHIQADEGSGMDRKTGR